MALEKYCGELRHSSADSGAFSDDLLAAWGLDNGEVMSRLHAQDAPEWNVETVPGTTDLRWEIEHHKYFKIISRITQK